MRRYIPPIGQLVKLHEWDDYHKLIVDNNLNPVVDEAPGVWSWFTVREVNGDTVRLEYYNCGHEDASHTGKFYTIPLASIDAPIGWEPRYTMYVKPDKVDTVINDWFKRGVVLRQSHDISCMGRRTFQPMDNAEQPHWMFPEVTDVIQPEDCPKIIRVVKIEEQEVNFVPDPQCGRCHGTGRDNVVRLAEARQSTVQVTLRLIENGDIQLIDFDAATGTYQCGCWASGFSMMSKKDRNRLKKEWEKDGWKVERIKYAGGYWIRTRETVVHDWKEA